MWETKEFAEYMSAHKQSPASTQRTLKMLSPILDNDFTNVTTEQVENLIIDFMPTSKVYIISVISYIKKYAKFLNNIELYNILTNIDKDVLWGKIKPICPVKYLSKSMFFELYNNIDRFEEHNTLYYKTLFWSIFEGIYSDDMDVVKNLRASDIDGNIVTLKKDDGYTYQIDIPEKLAEDLIELSKINIWNRPNRNGVCSVSMAGVYSDSCFKTECRKTNSETSFNYKHQIYRKLRKIYQNYVGTKLIASDIFVSGLMYKIKEALEERNIDFELAFSDPRKNKNENCEIIETIITKYNYSIKNATALRSRIKSHIDVFK